jgi:DNA ligase-1
MGNCSKIVEFITRVQALSGNNLASFISLHKDDEVVKAFLQYVYDTKKFVYGVKPKSEVYNTNINLDIIDWKTLMSEVKRLATERKNNLENQQALAALLDTYGIIAYSIFNRKIPNAVLGSAVINKVIPGLITEFKVAKAKELDWSKVLPDTKYIVERKYDGNNIYIINDRFFTREGHEVFLPKVKTKIPSGFKGVLVTEACVQDGRLGTRRLVQGLITKGRKGTIRDSEQQQLTFYCFDILTMEEWNTKICTTNYNERQLWLTDILSAFPAEYFQLVHSIKTSSAGVIKTFLDEQLRLGYEGIVVKPKYHYFEWKRSWNWMRFKEAKTADLKIIGIEEGTGKYAGQLGAFLCTGSVEGKDVVVKVGQGFTEAHRELLYNTKYIGSIIEVTYNEVTVNNSLSIPLFIDFRHDKEDSDNA